jgi:hypothetical protein
LNLLLGISDQPLRAREHSSQNSSGLVTSPGNRQPMPTMAIGSGVFLWAPLDPLAAEPFVVAPLLGEPLELCPLTPVVLVCELAVPFAGRLPLEWSLWVPFDWGRSTVAGVRTRGSCNSPFTGTALGAMAAGGSRQEREAKAA